MAIPGKKVATGADQLIRINGFLGSAQGTEFMEWLKLVCEVETSLEKEEEFDARSDVTSLTPLCPLRLAKRSGLRSAYYKVVAAQRCGAALLVERMTDERRAAPE